MSTVNERFKDIRKELGFNQQQFAYELGISQTHISGIENGRDNPSASLLKLLCAKFAISEEWLFDGVGTPLPSWDMETDEGVLSKYNAMRVLLEKALRSSTGEDLVNMVQSIICLAAVLDARQLSIEQTTLFRRAICSSMQELEELTMKISSDSILPSKNDAMGWVAFKNSCSAATNRINQSIKDAVNVYLERYGEEMKL